MNGMCFDMHRNSFDSLMDREQIYELHELEVEHYHDTQCVQSAKLFWAKQHKQYRFLQGSEAQMHYLDLCLRGCEAFGRSFLDDFKNTTTFWDIDPGFKEERIWQGLY